MPERKDKRGPIAGGGPGPADASQRDGQALNLTLDHWTTRKVPEEEVFNRKFQEIFMSGKTFAS